MYVDENTSQAASVEFVRLQRTNYARSRLQNTVEKAQRAFSTSSREGFVPPLFCIPKTLRERPMYRSLNCLFGPFSMNDGFGDQGGPVIPISHIVTFRYRESDLPGTFEVFQMT